MSYIIDKSLEYGKRYLWGFLLIQREEFDKFIKTIQMRFGKDIKVLDVGCYTCLMFNYLYENYGITQYYGIDIIDVKGRDKSITFFTMSGDSLLFDANQFHAVLFIESLDHIVDYVNALREAYRVLVSGGGVFIQCQTLHFEDETHFHVLHHKPLARLMKFLGFREIMYKDAPNFVVCGFK